MYTIALKQYYLHALHCFSIHQSNYLCVTCVCTEPAYKKANETQCFIHRYGEVLILWVETYKGVGGMVRKCSKNCKGIKSD